MTRRARLKSLAKINLDLRVLNRRADGYHELRTVFQTISRADGIEIDFEPAKRTDLRLEDQLGIPDNLILRSARATLDALRVHARVRFRLRKRIPMGAGLGGGSSNAAAVLLALPVLAGRRLTLERMLDIARALGSDVPFFLTGGTAVGLGRGEELYPLADLRNEAILVAFPGFPVSTPEAYRELSRGLTFAGSSSSIKGFQEYVRTLSERRSASLAGTRSANDFESVVFRQFPQIPSLRRKLEQSGAAGVRMTGSGSALFALFGSREQRERARAKLNGDRVFRGCELVAAELVNRASYRRLWLNQLKEHLNLAGVRKDQFPWPLPSRYER
jgi:4-diphosphocytidyl-2-C-methyl-D-erythritol kinase